jgi:hypothetical protein
MEEYYDNACIAIHDIEFDDEGNTIVTCGETYVHTFSLKP